ncbi:hypothetical protein QJS10_CPA06g00449 [Acorus calamus]|uniref:N-acetyltransferase domain-containing protein n=1 Tax=Acorus calamus TaxID=4465 RepID=A0AAV9ENA8_ACOCL|nr:hypothetical protein QJS10_CPA06g00449 [Acorus calamus]
MAEPSPPKVTLRKFDLSDVDDFLKWASDPRVTRYGRYDTPITTRPEALAHIRDVILPHPWFRAICVGDDDDNKRAVGSISVDPCESEKCRAAMGCRLAYEYWGKGIAARAVEAVVKQIFEEWPHLMRLEAVADVENVASQRSLEKAGLMREGLLRRYVVSKGRARDVVMYSVLSSSSSSKL